MTQDNLTHDDLSAARALADAASAVKTQLGRIIVGQEAVIEELLIALFSKGHCLLEGVQACRIRLTVEVSLVQAFDHIITVFGGIQDAGSHRLGRGSSFQVGYMGDQAGRIGGPVET